VFAVRQEGRVLSRLGVIALVVLALGVSACGRKGPLKPPPGSLATHAGEQHIYGPGEHGKAVDHAAREEEPKKPFFLDFLL